MKRFIHVCMDGWMESGDPKNLTEQKKNPKDNIIPEFFLK